MDDKIVAFCLQKSLMDQNIYNYEHKCLIPVMRKLRDAVLP